MEKRNSSNSHRSINNIQWTREDNISGWNKLTYACRALSCSFYVIHNITISSITVPGPISIEFYNSLVERVVPHNVTGSAIVNSIFHIRFSVRFYRNVIWNKRKPPRGSNDMERTMKGWCFCALVITDVPDAYVRLGSSLDPDSIREGTDVYFDCIVTAHPAVYKVEWKHNVSSNTILGVWYAK